MYFCLNGRHAVLARKPQCGYGPLSVEHHVSFRKAGLKHCSKSIKTSRTFPHLLYCLPCIQLRTPLSLMWQTNRTHWCNDCATAYLPSVAWPDLCITHLPIIRPSTRPPQSIPLPAEYRFPGQSHGTLPSHLHLGRRTSCRSKHTCRV
jgi:hypothetical protein